MARRIPLGTLARYCRSLATMLHSGVSILKAFETAGGKGRDGDLREVSQRIIRRLREGTELSRAMADQGEAFPPLMLEMVAVAERTGTLPEVLTALGDHYDNLLSLRKSFTGQIMWPVFQLVAAILVIALLILIIGIVGSARGGPPVDVLQMGLVGPTGAMMWLGGWVGLAIGGYIGYQLLVKGLRQQALVHGALLKIPVLGPCLRMFAVARFSWAFALTQQAGMSIQPSLESSLRATANGAFAAEIPKVVSMINQGEDLTTALAETDLFPRDYIEMVRVGETSGTVPEQLERMSPQLESDARRSLGRLTTALGWLIWGIVAAIIIFLIFRVFSFYMGLINDAMKGI